MKNMEESITSHCMWDDVGNIIILLRNKFYINCKFQAYFRILTTYMNTLMDTNSNVTIAHSH